MAINLLTGFNWNEARKGYREGEVEDQNDAQFLLEQERRGLYNQATRDQLAFEDQMRPLRLQQATQQGQLGALNLLEATRRNELGMAAQPGQLALTDLQGRYRTDLAGSLDTGALAQLSGQQALAGGQLRLDQTQGALSQQPLRQTLGTSQLVTAINEQPARAALSGQGLELARAQTDLQRGQVATETQLLPARAAAAAQGIATNGLLTQLSGEQAQANMALLPQASQARAAEIQERLRLLARQANTGDRRDALVNLSDTMANPAAIQTLAANEGMDPVTYLDQMNAIMAQQGTSLNLLSGAGPVDLASLTPRSREEAMLQRMMMAGRMNPQRPQVTNVRAPAAGPGAAGAAAGATNPVTGQPSSPLLQASTADDAPAAADPEHQFLQSLFPTTQQIQQTAQQAAQAGSIPKPPPVPDGVRPDDIKAVSKGTNWGGFSTDDLSKVVQAGQQAGYSQAQIAAAGQELYKRRLATMRSASPGGTPQ